jgi:phage-related protein
MELFKLFGSIFVKNEDANKSIDETDKKAKDTDGTFSKMAGTVGKWGLAVGVAAGAAAVAIGVKAFTATEDLQKALNGLQASTGTTTNEMDSMKNAMLDIYNNNFGESFEDIGQAMATIRQQTKLSGQELSDTTKNAIAMRDTFGIEVTESIRSVNQLMKNFGIDSTTAYNLLTQGAQNGLNANENLADTVNEYSVHFAQLGLNATDMFNSLVNGANSGVFDIDKLGDAVKEFGIRVKDNSDTTNGAFQALGLNAQQIGEAFAKGGETGKQAFETVTTKINEMKDPMLQNQVGVALFGTMFEDVGVKGIASLTNLKGGIDANSDSLKQLNEIKYDTFSEAITGIGRQFETSVFIPLGEKILPIMNKFANWISDNMPMIKEVIGTAMNEVEYVFNTVYNFVKDNIMPIFEQLSENTMFNFDTIKNIINDVVNFITTTILPPLQTYFEFIMDEIVPRLVQAFQDWFPKIANIVENLWIIIKAILTELKAEFDIVFPYIQGVVMVAFDIIKGAVDVLLGVLSGLIEFIAGVFTNDWEKAWNGIKTIFASIFDGIKNIFQTQIDWLTSKIEWVLEKIQALKNAASNIGSSISSGVSNAVSWFGGARANGGSVKANQTYLVGERGPELFTSNTAGTIIPNNKLSTAGTTINITLTGNTIMNDRDADKLGDLLVGRLKILGVT